MIPTRQFTAGLLSLLFALALTWSAHGQTEVLAKLADATPEQLAAAQTNYMSEHLTLSQAQLEALTSLNLDSARKGARILRRKTPRHMTQGNLIAGMDSARKVADMQKLGRRHEARLSRILDDQQFEAYEEMKPAMRNAVVKSLLASMEQDQESPP
ncbi:hypothetical protein MK489_02080 [Myxococcota bacterium]|nr:hypothetical protein [Myxococcota bacterium]